MSKLNEKYTDDVILDAVADATYDMWKTIAASFPEVKTGDLQPVDVIKLQDVMGEVVEQWLLTNQPPEKQLYTVNVYRTVVQKQTFTITEPSEQEAINRAFQESKDVYDDAPYWDEIGTPIITRAEVVK